MSVNEPKLTQSGKWLSVIMTPSDKAILEAISKQDGESSMAAVVRRLIRQEGVRRNISITLDDAVEVQ